jgi:mannan endo-1,4-beta-mannosidase
MDPKVKINLFPPSVEIGVSVSAHDFDDFKKSLDRTAKRIFRNRKVAVLGVYWITAKHSGKALDVQDWNQEAGGNVFQYDLHRGLNQQWIVTQANAGYYFIFSKFSGKCLDVDGASKEVAANVFQWSFHGGTNQQWELLDAGGGYFHIMNRNSMKVLDVAGFSSENCANVMQYELHGGDNQKWKFWPVENS